MTPESIHEAILEAERFNRKAHQALSKIEEDSYFKIAGCKETAACKRASLDLTRALAKMKWTR